MICSMMKWIWAFNNLSKVSCVKSLFVKNTWVPTIFSCVSGQNNFKKNFFTHDNPIFKWNQTPDHNYSMYLEFYWPATSGIAFSDIHIISSIKARKVFRNQELFAIESSIQNFSYSLLSINSYFKNVLVA